VHQRRFIRSLHRPLVLAAALVTFVLAGHAAAPEALLDIGLIGHRGLTAHEPENSLEAVKAAIDLGIYGAEIDLRTTRDGAVVLLHDATLERMTTGSGAVADMTAEQLRGLRLRERAGGPPSSKRIPTLDEVFALARRYPAFQLTLDLKAVDIPLVAKRVLTAGLADQVTFFTGGVTDVAAAKAVKAVESRLRIAVDMAGWWRTEGLTTFAAAALDADVLFAAEWNFPKYGFAEGRDTGKRVHVFVSGTDNLRERVRKAAALGAQAVSSDRPDQLVDIARR
jgi:glycerophosphoryl diester phosphodiesterase